MSDTLYTVDRRLRRPTPRRRKRASRGTNTAAFLFLLPWMLGVILITAGPMAMSLVLAFTEYDLLSPPEFNGFENIERMASDPRLAKSLEVTFTYVLVGVPLQLIVALLIAVGLNTGTRGLAFYRSVFYLPSLLGSSVAIAVLWRQVFGTEGLINQMLAIVGVQGPSWLSNPDTSLGAIITLHVWTFGAPMIIFLAGLRNIPESYYEAAQVDGAGRWRRFCSITLPLLTPMIFFNLILQIIGAFQAFTQAYIVSGGTGGPSDSTLFFSIYLYQRGFGAFDMGYASAMAWLLLLLTGLFIGINFLASKYWVFYDD